MAEEPGRECEGDRGEKIANYRFNTTFNRRIDGKIWTRFKRRCGTV